jgi:hypothetical protein
MSNNVISMLAARDRLAACANKGLRTVVREYGVAWRAGDIKRAMWLWADGAARFGDDAIMAAFKWQAVSRIDAALPPCPDETVLDHRERLVVSVHAELEQMGARNAAARARQLVEEYHRA